MLQICEVSVDFKRSFRASFSSKLKLRFSVLLALQALQALCLCRLCRLCRHLSRISYCLKSLKSLEDTSDISRLLWMVLDMVWPEQIHLDLNGAFFDATEPGLYSWTIEKTQDVCALGKMDASREGHAERRSCRRTERRIIWSDWSWLTQFSYVESHLYVYTEVHT